jgi:hypothetical protein
LISEKFGRGEHPNEFVIYNNEIADVHPEERVLGASNRVTVLKARVKDPKHNEEGGIGESERVRADG